MYSEKFDLHMHSNCSDGTDTPEEVVKKAAENGVSLMALTDHDTVMGVPEALRTGKTLGVHVLPAVEMDTEWSSEVHILGLDLDPSNQKLKETLEKAGERRIHRNQVIVQKLQDAGINVAPYLTKSPGTITRLHIGLAIVQAGYADTMKEAFSKYLRKGCPGYYTAQRLSPEEVIGLIRGAGGVAVWAHPCHLKGSIHEMLEKMAAWGIQGLEAYHSSQTEGESELIVSLARQKKLLVTCGSDSHGAHRTNVNIGCTWRDTPELQTTYHFFMERLQNPRNG